MKLFIVTTAIFVSMVYAAVESVGMPVRNQPAATVLIVDTNAENIIHRTDIAEGTCQQVEMAKGSPKLFTPTSSRDPYTTVIATSDTKEMHYNCVPFKAVKHSIGYQESGKASWYGPNFHGRKTASGIPYNQKSPITVAHKTLPLGSVLKVSTSTASTCVLVKDRGPYHPGRVLDLSETLAKKLGVYQHGTADIDVELVGYTNLKKLKKYLKHSPMPKSISC